MSGFVSKPAAAAVAPAAVQGDPWFPSIDPAALRLAERIDNAVTDERLRAVVVNAMMSVDRDLAAWADAHKAAGVAALAALPAPTYDGESRLVALYRRAVYSAAKAEVVERYRDVDTTGAGQRRAEDLEPTVDEHRRNSRWAVSDLLGRTRTTVELI